MPLNSRLFRGDQLLEKCAVLDSAHITLGKTGDHVSKIHTALLVLDDVSVAANDLRDKRYGPTTAAAVLAYKTRRQIINRSYQKTADNIVGKMTIVAMDREMVVKENIPDNPFDPQRDPSAT